MTIQGGGRTRVALSSPLVPLVPPKKIGTCQKSRIETVSTIDYLSKARRCISTSYDLRNKPNIEIAVQRRLGDVLQLSYGLWLPLISDADSPWPRAINILENIDVADWFNLKL